MLVAPGGADLVEGALTDNVKFALESEVVGTVCPAPDKDLHDAWLRRLGALAEQFEAARAHFRVMLVGKQFEPVVERADRAEQIVAQPRAQQAGEIDGGHRHGISGFRVTKCRIFLRRTASGASR